MDCNSDGILNVKEVVTSLGLTCVADITVRLRLFFILHLPPILPTSELKTPPSSAGKIIRFFFFFFIHFH